MTATSADEPRVDDFKNAMPVAIIDDDKKDPAENIVISRRHPGGNIKVINASGNKIQFEQELRDTPKWWFYWNFSAENLSEQKHEITFEFMNRRVVGPWGPSVSTDGDVWEWLGAENSISRSAFKYSFEPGEKKYFSFSIPYQHKHFRDFYVKYRDDERLQKEVLTTSEKGRPVDLLLLGNFDSEKHIIFTARSHACESPASYVLEGMLEHWLTQQDSTFLDEYFIHVVPFVDIDGVEEGDQGKDRAPHDHNRDYTEDPIYNSTAAIMDYAKSLEGNIVIYIDFHSPWKWGGIHNHIFFVKTPSPSLEETRKLCGIIEELVREDPDSGSIPYNQSRNLNPGESFNDPGNPTGQRFFWEQGANISVACEFPYFHIS